MVRLDGPGGGTICALFPSIVPVSRHHLHTTQCLVSSGTSYASVYGALRGLYTQFFGSCYHLGDGVSRRYGKDFFDRYRFSVVPSKPPELTQLDNLSLCI